MDGKTKCIKQLGWFTNEMLSLIIYQIETLKKEC